MSMFPGANASIIRNEAGEVLGWDYPGEPDYDPTDFLAAWDEDDEDEDDTEDDTEDTEAT